MINSLYLPGMSRYKVVTLGCRTNQYESEALSGQLQKRGYCRASANEKVEVGIVNTCSVTQSADRRSLYQIRKLEREHRPDTLIVTGCSAEKCKKVPAITHLIPNSKKEVLLPSVFPEVEWSEFHIERFGVHTRAYVKIQDGCNSFCRYCVIPFVRGPSRSRRIGDILDEVALLVENGYKEVVLTGVNIGDFGRDHTPKVSVSKLIAYLEQIEGLRRIRISSINPNEVDDEMVEVFLSGKKICHSLHLVLQAGSDRILERMRRPYTKQDFLEITQKLRRGDEDFTFTTDVIVGFPGETEREFMETSDLIREAGFAKVHIFPYSDRPKTGASRMTYKVDKEVICERKQRLHSVAEEVAFRLRNRYVGREFEILLESRDRGYTRHFLPVSISDKGLRANEIVHVKCVKNSKEGLKGHL